MSVVAWRIDAIGDIFYWAWRKRGKYVRHKLETACRAWFLHRKCNAIDLRGDWVTRRYILLSVQIGRISLSLVNNKIRKCLQMPIKIRPDSTGDFCRRVERAASILVIYRRVFTRAPHPIHHQHGRRVRFTRSRLFIVIKRIICWRDQYVVSSELHAVIASWILTRVWRIYRCSSFMTSLLTPFVIEKLHLYITAYEVSI